jgi:hypothetical protein
VAKPGLYANIHAKRKRIAAGSGEKMRKPGAQQVLLLLLNLRSQLRLLRKNSSRNACLTHTNRAEIHSDVVGLEAPQSRTSCFSWSEAGYDRHP